MNSESKYDNPEYLEESTLELENDINEAQESEEENKNEELDQNSENN